MSRELKDWLAYTGLLCVIGAGVGALASAIWFDYRNSQSCPAGTAYIQQHCVVVAEPRS